MIIDTETLFHHINTDLAEAQRKYEYEDKNDHSEHQKPFIEALNQRARMRNVKDALALIEEYAMLPQETKGD